MSLKNAEEVLGKFIKKDIAGVLVIKWSWGSGKTYFLEKDFLMKHKDDLDLWFKKYSYVSLFGLKNINDLKLSIYQNSIESENIWREVLFSDKIKNKKEWFKKWKKLLEPVVKDIKILNAFWNWIQVLWLLDPKEYLIVIDDFERINKNIDIDEVLWLISELKEKRKCKVILVMNDEKLNSEDLEHYNILKEKIIDIEIDFIPTPEECANTIFDFSKKDEKDLWDLCIKLWITNIRFISKIRHFYEMIIQDINKKSYHFDLIFQIKSSVVFLINSFYWNPNDDENSSIVWIQFALTESKIGNFGLYSWENEEPKFSKDWRNIFWTYGWSHADEIDKEIYNIIKRWYIISEDLHSIASEKNLMFIEENIEKKYKELWDELYHCGFINNEEEFIKGFLEFFYKYSQYLDLNDLNTIVWVFRKLERSEDASKIIDFFIQKNTDNWEKMNLRKFRNHTSYNLDDEAKSKISEAYIKINSITLDPKEIIQRIIDNWYSITWYDEEVLFSLSENDIFDLISSLEWDLQREYIEILLIKRSFSNASEDWKRLSERTSKAVNRFNDCKINNSRLSSYWYL